MLRSIARKLLHGALVLLGMLAAALAVATLRFALYAPKTLDDILRTIGGRIA